MRPRSKDTAPSHIGLSAMIAACGAWLIHCTKSASRLPGVNTPTASAMTWPTRQVLYN